MKISVDDKIIFELNDTQKKVIMNDIPSDIFEDDMKRRLEYILMHKYEQCFKRLKNEWEPKLAEKYNFLPPKPDAFAQLVFTHPDYLCRKQREDKLKKDQEALNNPPVAVAEEVAAVEAAHEGIAVSENKVMK